jgi:hypothetical protein
MLMTSERDDGEMYAGRRNAADGDAAGIENAKLAVKLPVAGVFVAEPIDEPPPPHPTNAAVAISAGSANRLRYVDIPEAVKRAPRKTLASFMLHWRLSLPRTEE